MSLTVDEIESEALKLSPESRAELLERLLLKYGEDSMLDDDIARAWLDEAERRDQAMDSGREPGIPAEEVFRRLRSSIG